MKADAAVPASAADRSCAANCRLLLEQQVTNAQSEVEKARAEIDTAVARARSDLNTARAKLLNTPPPPSMSPLADRLGIAPWTLDLIVATLQSVGINGLGAALIALGAHSAQRPRVSAAEPPRPVEVAELQPVDPPVTATTAATVETLRPKTPAVIEDTRPIAGVAEFAVRRLDASEHSHVDVAALHAVYCEWSATTDRRAMSRAEFEKAFVAVCEKAGHPVMKKGRRFMLGA